MWALPVGASWAQPAGAGKDRVVLVVGDSLSAEYGLPRGTGWVALLEKKLTQEKVAARVVNASISGDTTSGGRSRLSPLLEKHRPQVVIVELGANDALRGLPLQQTRDNLAAMTAMARQTGAKVLLLGMQVPPNYGSQYTTDFAKVFVDVSQAQKTMLVPFLLKGIADGADSQRWFQPDRIHPNAQAQGRILENVWPYLRRLLD